MGAKAHLGEALRWSSETEVELVQILSAALGMAGPVLLAGAMGRLPLGLAAALGSFVVGVAGAGASAKDQAKEIALALGCATLASIVAALTAGHGWISAAGVVLLAGIAALLGGYSRPLAVATTRFVFVLIIVGKTADATSARTGFLLLLAAGALWATIVSLSLGCVARRIAGRSGRANSGVLAFTGTVAQKLQRWKKTLAQPAGWQYALRLALCLGVAEILRLLWPERHLYWVAVTVLIVLQRRIEILAVKATQRTLGTLIGVLVGSLFFVHQPTTSELIIGIGLLGGARPLLRARNYLAYSAVMAPLVLLLMDGTGPFGAGVLVDRLLATIIGAVLVVLTNWGAAVIIGRRASEGPILFSRGPVLMLWAVVVAERLGFNRQEALSLGRAVTESSASAKGRALRMSQSGPAASKETELRNGIKHGEALRINIMQCEVPAVRGQQGVRALSKGEPIEPASVERYLESKFGTRLGAARLTMEILARSYAPEELAERAFALYEMFRPEVPEGAQGWGAAGVLDLRRIEKLTASSATSSFRS